MSQNNHTYLPSKRPCSCWSWSELWRKGRCKYFFFWYFLARNLQDRRHSCSCIIWLFEVPLVRFQVLINNWIWAKVTTEFNRPSTNEMPENRYRYFSEVVSEDWNFFYRLYSLIQSSIFKTLKLSCKHSLIFWQKQKL